MRLSQTWRAFRRRLATAATVLVINVSLLATPSAAIGANSVAPDESNLAAGNDNAPTFALHAYTALGSALARNSRLGELGWSEREITAFLDGVRAAMHGHAYAFDHDTQVLSDNLQKRIHELDQRQEYERLTSPAGLAAFIKDARKKARLRETDSGLCYRFISSGTGVRPRPGDTVILSYRCMLANSMSEVSNLSASRLQAKVTDLLPGLAEGIQMMTVGSRAIFLLPPTLSYGSGDWPTGIDRGLPLAFVVELHEVVSGS